MLQAFIYGVILAFGLIIPLGAQNIFVFNQGASQKHFLNALPVVITASLCDTLLIILAVSGVSLIVLKILWVKTIIFTIGLFFLLYMAYSIWNNSPAKLGTPAKAFSPKRQIMFTLSVSLLNPHAIMDTVIVIGTSALNFSGNARVAYTVACILVSFFWFLGLALLGRTIHRLDNTGFLMTKINKFSALIVFAIAIYIAYQLVITLFH